MFLRLSPTLCSPLGLGNAISSRCHPASYKSFCFPSLPDPGPSSGVRLIPFPTQSMATPWCHTRTLSTSSGAKEVTSKSKSKRKSRRQSPKAVGVQTQPGLKRAGWDGRCGFFPLCSTLCLQPFSKSWEANRDIRKMAVSLQCPIPGGRLERALRKTGPVEGRWPCPWGLE